AVSYHLSQFSSWDINAREGWVQIFADVAVVKPHDRNVVGNFHPALVKTVQDSEGNRICDGDDGGELCRMVQSLVNGLLTGFGTRAGKTDNLRFDSLTLELLHDFLESHGAEVNGKKRVGARRSVRLALDEKNSLVTEVNEIFYRLENPAFVINTNVADGLGHRADIFEYRRRSTGAKNFQNLGIHFRRHDRQSRDTHSYHPLHCHHQLLLGKL